MSSESSDSFLVSVQPDDHIIDLALGATVLLIVERITGRSVTIMLQIDTPGEQARKHGPEDLKETYSQRHARHHAHVVRGPRVERLVAAERKGRIPLATARIVHHV